MATQSRDTAARRPLSDLLEGIADRALTPAERALPVSGVFDDSRQVQPGGIFVAIRGTDADGRTFVGDALARGAAVLVGEDLSPDENAVVVNVDNARAALARLAARWYGLDGLATRDFRLIAITGTNGKTTTAYMTQAILHAAGLRCGLLSTVHYDLCGRVVPAPLTTPGALQVAQHLRECIYGGARAAVMEASSHALDQRRIDGLRVSAAAFTNLTQDHLDYHETFEAYRKAKARLFEGLDASAAAVVNRDDPNHAALLHACQARVVTYAVAAEADVVATITRDTIGGTSYRLRIGGSEHPMENALVGRHNVYNALAAAALAAAVDVPRDAIERGLNTLRSVPGRLQRVSVLPGVEVFVDYAHTPDALHNAAGVLRPLCAGRLIIVFGCGGDRDRTKRPLMARATAEFGDTIVLTSDNPRTEDPDAIIADALAGFDEQTKQRVIVEPDRRRAIFAALECARPGDVVLIAGKGHEDYQVVGRQRLHFDDTEVASAAATELRSRRGDG